MDLICYLHPAWRPLLRPAPATRAWMDATSEAFAYRCLPLNIANAHGWELVSPCGFEARWNGGALAGDVVIRLDPGADPAHAPVALFGQGVLTFHVEGIFRTPESWNLWVSGPPNQGKDGIAPLTGVIETDWSPYTFTMNRCSSTASSGSGCRRGLNASNAPRWTGNRKQKGSPASKRMV